MRNYCINLLQDTWHEHFNYHDIVNIECDCSYRCTVIYFKLIVMRNIEYYLVSLAICMTGLYLI